jgi:hypothetical protein
MYITPEVGVDPNAPAAIIAAAKQVAVGFNSNFIPQNFGTLPNSPAVDDIFVFINFVQGNVLASAPHPAGPANTDTNYSPLWQVNLVSWNSGRQGRVLTSQTDITDAAAVGNVHMNGEKNYKKRIKKEKRRKIRLIRFDQNLLISLD